MYGIECHLNNDKPCVHCVDDGHRLVCMHKEAKIDRDGFSHVSIQNKCPMKKRVIYNKDKYNRNRNNR